MGGLTFAQCQCHKTPFVLPDADPDNKWDEELEEGETILTIDFTQAILIRAHHANDLAAVRLANSLVRESHVCVCKIFCIRKEGYHPL